MTPAEAAALVELPEYVRIFRGQRQGDLPDQPSGMSWTLAEEVADWYAAPIPGQTTRGRVLSALVPRHAVIALFLARAETEVIVDLAVLQGLSISSRAGRLDEFPPHLMAGKSPVLLSMSTMLIFDRQIAETRRAGSAPRRSRVP